MKTASVRKTISSAPLPPSGEEPNNDSIKCIGTSSLAESSETHGTGPGVISLVLPIFTDVRSPHEMNQANKSNKIETWELVITRIAAVQVVG